MEEKELKKEIENFKEIFGEINDLLDLGISSEEKLSKIRKLLIIGSL